MPKPQKWTEVYPQGTKEGDEEQRFFIALTRDQRAYRSYNALVNESKLSPKRVDEILEKYVNLGMIFANENDDGMWAYWERVPERIQEYVPLVKKDQTIRIKKHFG